ncbi:MAG: glycosyltransferase [Bacteroides sp.]|nr:glycosyltransferase [Bacteroides sp.]
MILSIGMIVKNEEKYLERCLTALKPLLDEVDSELIIADTGSTDGTAEIAKRFTDNVYSFEWVNDFSAARNSTLERAKGEWYMFIDADEILQSCGDIIRFFKSGEYKRYNSATYVQRSYQSMVNGEIDYKSYNDFRPLRLTKRFEEIAFIGIIHENLTPFYKPVKHLDAIADHFGYIFYEDRKTAPFAAEKSRRNLIPLLKTLDELKPDEKPDNSIYKKIADCYTISEDYEKALEYLDKGLNTVDKSNIGIIPYYSDKIYMLFYLKRYDEMLSLSDEYFSGANAARKTPLASDILVHFFRGGAYYRVYRFKEAIAEFGAFFDLYDKYKSGKLNTEDMLYSTLSLSDLRLRSVLLCFYDSCIKIKDYYSAVKYKAPFSVSGLFDDPNDAIEYTRMKLDIMRNTDYSELTALYSQLDSDCQRQILFNLRWELFGADSEKQREMIDGLVAATSGCPKEAEAIDIFGNALLNGNVDFNKIEKYLQKYGTAFNADILYMMIDKNVDITPFVNAKDFLANECVHAVFAMRDDFFDLLEKYDVDVISEKGLEKSAELYKYAIAKAASLKMRITGLLAKYGKIGLNRQDSVGENEMPKETEAAVMASRIASAAEKNDYKLCINEMNRLLAAFPEFSPIIKAYLTEVEARILKNRSTV